MEKHSFLRQFSSGILSVALTCLTYDIKNLFSSYRTRNSSYIKWGFTFFFSERDNLVPTSIFLCNDHIFF